MVDRPGRLYYTKFKGAEDRPSQVRRWDYLEEWLNGLILRDEGPIGGGSTGPVPIPGTPPTDGSQYEGDILYDLTTGIIYQQQSDVWVIVHGPNMVWLGEWAQQQYYEQAVVEDGAWRMVANKDTTDRAAPQPIGTPTWALPDVPTLNALSYTGVVWSGIKISNLQNSYWVSKVRAWIPDVSPNAHYQFVSEDNISGVLTGGIEFDGDILSVPGWVEWTISGSFLFPTDDVTLWLVSQNSAGTTDFNHPWVYEGTDNNTGPALAGGWNRSSQQTTVRLDYLDDDGTDRQAELAQGATPGTNLRLAEEGDLSSFWEYNVVLGIDLGTYWEYTVQLIDTGGVGVGVAERCQVYFEVPIASPTQYVSITNQHLNDPGLDGQLQLGTAAPTTSDDSYGMDVFFQQYTASPDWDILSVVDASAGGGAATTAAAFGVSEFVEPEALATMQAAWDYRFRTSTSPTPTAGSIARDNVDPTLATMLYLHRQDENSHDESFTFGQYKKGHYIVIHDDTDADRFEAYYITSDPTKNGDIFEVPVLPVSQNGAALSNNMQVGVYWRAAGSYV